MWSWGWSWEYSGGELAAGANAASCAHGLKSREVILAKVRKLGSDKVFPKRNSGDHLLWEISHRFADLEA